MYLNIYSTLVVVIRKYNCSLSCYHFLISDYYGVLPSRKTKALCNGAGTSGESTFPYIPKQSTTDSEITEDGFRWRKYGQKVVKGSSYPR